MHRLLFTIASVIENTTQEEQGGKLIYRIRAKQVLWEALVLRVVS